MSCPYTQKCKKFNKNECTYPECIKLYKIKQLQQSALLSEKQCQKIDLYLDADKADKSAFITLKKFETDILKFVDEGKNLFIYSSTCGNGKTSWAIRMINSYIEKVWHSSDMTCRALFINVPRFLINLKDNISQKIPMVYYIKENCEVADLVVWDDIATKGFTEYEMENILQLINLRCDLGKSNIYTSNLSGDLLRSSIGDRLYSRVFNGSCKVELVGADKRGLNYDSVTVSK